MLACNGARQKVQLVCAAPSSGLPGFAWQLNGTCASTENCDQTDGSCKTIIPQCVGKNPGDAFCDAQPGAPSPAPYLDVRKTCGADLVTTTSMTCSGVCDVVNGCQNPRCGDVKVETGEACDDGNTLPLDGCEPVSAGATNACQKSAITSVSAGYGHTCGLFKGGYVRCWGANDNNQLGLGHAQFMADHKPYELDVMDSSGGFTKPAGALDFGASVTATQVSAGLDFSCALLSDQTVHCWGVNASGQLGLGNTNPFLSGTPNTIGKVALGGNATAIAVAGSTACATLTDGTVRCWGSNAGAILGVGATVDLSTSTPVQTAAMYSGWVSLGATATAIDVGSSTACALLTGGSIRCWGSNGSGQLGTGMSTQFSRTMVPSAYSAVLLPSGKTATSISVGAGTVCTRLSDSTAQCWGDNSAGQIGNGTTASVGAFSSPATDGLVLTPAAGVVSITAGKGNSTCAFYSNGGGVHCWGDNSKGQLGYGDVTNRGNTQQTLPSSATACPPLSFGSGVTAATIAVGSGHMCAILSTGQLRCWGWNLYGQLGLGYTSPAPTDYVGGTASTTPSSSSTLVPLFPP
jgi:cysteine-rich repeat protein